MATFYRAVSLAELADIRQTHQLRIGRGSCEGKHMAVTAVHAARWGRALHETDFAVVRITVYDAQTAQFMRWDNLDGIGAACFATIEELANAIVDEVSDES